MPREKAFLKPATAFGLFLAALFLFRLFYGLTSDIWFIDQHQIYLIGLKFYCTHAWPYFGPDVGHYIQLPGALQGLVVGLPLMLCPWPESPYVALAVLSFAGLGFFAWYACRQLPDFPAWIVWGFTLSLPWSLNWSTNIDNDSYTLFGACLFFTAFLESLPALALGLWPRPFGFYLMGFGLLWCAQFHMSYVLLFGFLAAALLFQARAGLKALAACGAGLALGALTTGAFLIPTYLTYGWASGSGGMAKAVALNPENLKAFFTVAARFLSLASFEIPRFIGANSQERLGFLHQQAWLWPFALVLFAAWIAQVLAMLVMGFQSRPGDRRWQAVRILAGATFLGIYLSFLFAIKAPAAHTYYLTLPLALFYAFYCLKPWAGRAWFKPLAGCLMACNLAFHLGVGLAHYSTKSLYVNRPFFEKAIAARDYHLFGERRDGTRY
ncbi:MAG TPA: hypothetical protein VMU88_09765 [bacterium]|nr:hypothetical protein [bacterium]